MADKKKTKSEEQEKTIPVLIVFKNNTILKNIFLLDNPQPKPIETVVNGDPPVQEFEETLLVGRHPDCNITLEHPSISRFHLRIHSKLSSHKLSVIDLYSVHGTWISGKKIVPGIQIELNEGDTMHLGGSSGVYRLHWVLLRRAYDMEMSPSDVSMQVEEIEEEGTHQLQNNSIAREKWRWNMVVDTTCLLNKESRKALQLLQGLKGIQLIIPRIVIRELGCMKQRGSLFRRKTEVSSALQWIEECMVNTNWWIHVQSSEEGRPIAPTPPASPRSQFSEGNGGFPGGAETSSAPFSAWGSVLEIVSPTAQDHILECALLFRRIKNDGPLVLLTNDVTLKIKATAEGMICETVEEFRESLVNPFSERFLWADSSLRGPTWSCADDIVLREKYYSCPSRKPSNSGEGAKVLKLILLNNSRNAETLVSYTI